MTVGAHYRPQDGSIVTPDDKTRDLLGNAIVRTDWALFSSLF